MADIAAARRAGASVRLKLALSYAAFLMLAGALLLAVVWVFLLRYVPDFQFTKVPGGGAVLINGPSRSDLVRAFAPKAALALGGLLVLSVVGGWFIAGRMLAPLRRITDATRLAATGSLSHRVHLDGPRDELRELADAFDAMLARLEAHVGEQRRFAANASHELRTPLAIMHTLLEVAAHDPGQHDDALVRHLRSVNDRAIDLTEALLVLGRAQQRTFSRERVDLSLLAEEAIEGLVGLAEQRHVTLSITGTVAPTLGSRPLLLQMITNLVHNAIVHNLTDGGWVRVDTAAEHTTVMVTVENTGVLVSPQLMATLTEPFQRGAERVRTDHGGAGLGLAIVDSIVAAHDGQMTIEPRAGGGLVVRALLRCAATSEAVRAGAQLETGASSGS